MGIFSLNVDCFCYDNKICLETLWVLQFSFFHVAHDYRTKFHFSNYLMLYEIKILTGLPFVKKVYYWYYQLGYEALSINHFLVCKLQISHLINLWNCCANIFIFGLLEFFIWIQIFGKHFEGSDLHQLFIEQFRNAYTKIWRSRKIWTSKWFFICAWRSRGYMLQTTTCMLLRIS